MNPAGGNGAIPARTRNQRSSDVSGHQRSAVTLATAQPTTATCAARARRLHVDRRALPRATARNPPPARYSRNTKWQATTNHTPTVNSGRMPPTLPAVS